LEREEIKRVRESVQRGRPYGAGPWIERAVVALGLAHTLRNSGRPRKPAERIVAATG
jgi:putative transposase